MVKIWQYRVHNGAKSSKLSKSNSVNYRQKHEILVLKKSHYRGPKWIFWYMLWRRWSSWRFFLIKEYQWHASNCSNNSRLYKSLCDLGLCFKLVCWACAYKYIWKQKSYCYSHNICDRSESCGKSSSFFSVPCSCNFWRCINQKRLCERSKSLSNQNIHKTAFNECFYPHSNNSQYAPYHKPNSGPISIHNVVGWEIYGNKDDHVK